MTSDIEAQIKSLRREIGDADIAYYIYNDPIMSDYDYDMHVRELRALEEAYPEYREGSSPTERVNESVKDGAKKIAHATRMYSLDNIYNEEDFDSYVEYLIGAGIDPVNTAFVLNDKLDGAALELKYVKVNDGPSGTDKNIFELEKIVTRGDGYVGEDVTEYAKAYLDAPLHIALPHDAKYSTFRVRGEATVTTTMFKQVNELLEGLGFRTMASPRHMAAALLRTKNHKVEIPEKCICFMGYGMDDMTSRNVYGYKSYHEMETAVSSTGIRFVKGTLLVGTDQIKNVYQKVKSSRAKLDDHDIMTDGLVFRIDEFELQDLIGFTNKSPRFARAIKFPPESGSSVVKDILIQVGRTGILTPVAVVDPPILLGGVRVARATLHNYDFVQKMDVRIGDTITIERSGDVIPKVTGVIQFMRPENAAPFKFPDVCPECGSPTVKQADKVGVFCGDPARCPAGRVWYLTYVASRPGLNLIGFGESLVSSLYLGGSLVDMTSFFDLGVSDLIKVGVGKRHAEKLIRTIRERMAVLTLDELVRVMAIPGVGASTSKILTKEFGSLNRIQSATVEDLQNVPGIGRVTAEAIRQYFEDHDWVKKLTPYGFDLVAKSVEADRSSPWYGKRVRITGTLDKPRDSVMAQLEQLGAIPTSAVSKLDVLIVGEHPSGATLKSAKDAGVKIIHTTSLSDVVSTTP